MSARAVIRYAMWAVAIAVAQLCVAVAAFGAPLTARPQIALTFDDAPTAAMPLLHTLQEKNATATFFLVGEAVWANPEQARAIADAGMLIGNHSNDHAHLAGATAQQIRANLALAQTAIHAETGVTPTWFRPPYLDVSPHYDHVLPELGLRLSWPTINPKDWMGVPAQSIVGTVTRDAAPGAVVILHDMDNRTNTVEALPQLIDGLRALGYDLVTLDDIGLGAIEGTVRAGDGELLSGALVSAFDSHADVAATAVADAHGRYRLARLAGGWYRVGFSATGHVSGYFDDDATLASARQILVSPDFSVEGADVRLESLTALRVAATPSTVVSGEEAVVDVRLLRGTLQGRPIAGETIVVRTSSDGLTWGEPNSYVTDDSGAVSIRLRPRAPVHFRAEYAGRPGVFSPSQSGVADVDVITPLSTAVTARASSTRPAYGARVALTGTLSRAGAGQPELAGEVVRLQVLKAREWSDVAEASSSATGSVRFEVAPRNRTSYRLVYAGSYGTYRSCASEPVVITPKAAVGTPIAPATMERGAARTAYGTLRPAHRSGTRPVRIYRWRKVDGVWRRYGYVEATVAGSGEYSRYSAKVKLWRAGSWRLRAYAPADALHSAAWSSGYDYVRVK